MAENISTIKIDKLGDCEFKVTVGGDDSTSEYRVGLDDIQQYFPEYEEEISV